jgi:hypothetical protein
MWFLACTAKLENCLACSLALAKSCLQDSLVSVLDDSCSSRWLSGGEAIAAGRFLRGPENKVERKRFCFPPVLGIRIRIVCHRYGSESFPFPKKVFAD